MYRWRRITIVNDEVADCYNQSRFAVPSATAALHPSQLANNEGGQK